MESNGLWQFTAASLFPVVFNRSQKPKMRFWSKGRQWEKKTSREKLATQSELLELHPDQNIASREMVPGLQLDEGNHGGATVGRFQI